MDAIESILTRRSIRRFTPQQVSEELLRKILEAGMMAPSAMDRRPWHFVVVKSRSMLEELSHLSTYSLMIKEAALAIIVCGDSNIESNESFLVQDCSIAATNLLHAVHALGLGAVWVGVHPRNDRIEILRKKFNLPLNILPLCLIPIGYPAENKVSKSRYDPTRIHHGKW